MLPDPNEPAEDRFFEAGKRRMRLDRRGLVLGGLTGASALSAQPAYAQASGPQPKPTDPTAHWFNIRDFGAAGDGATIDSPAINKAIDQAAAQGGGVVHFPPGTYACYTLRLKSRVTLHLGEGAVLLAASPTGVAPNGYDDPGPGAGNAYQDYGHSHWSNSLIHGEACTTSPSSEAA
jgi:polygalacturonase